MNMVDAEGLARRLHGDLIRPGDAGYGSGTRLWNGMISKHPALVARCAGNGDVAAAVSFARDNQLPLAIRGGGHGVAGQALCDDGLVVDLSAMTGVSVDAKARTVRAQGGAMAQADETGTAFGNRGKPYLIGVDGNSERRTRADANVAWVRDVIAALRQYSTGGVYLNFAGFLEEGEDLTREGLASYDRLAEIKARYDPDNIFRFNANIRPRR